MPFLPSFIVGRVGTWVVRQCSNIAGQWHGRMETNEEERSGFLSLAEMDLAFLFL